MPEKELQLADVLHFREERVALRQRRQAADRQAGREGLVCLTLTLNVPGPRKRSPLIDAFLAFARTLLEERLQAAGLTVLWREELQEVAGEAVFWGLSGKSAAQIKALTMAIEAEEPYGRLLDLDVEDENGQKCSREQPRRCLLCEQPAFICASRRLHSVADLVQAVERRMRQTLLAVYAEKLRERALAALRAELELTPKPGLVDLHNRGAHRDMDVGSFRRAMAVLDQWLERELQMAAAQALEPQGDFWEERYLPLCREAEAAVLAANQGVNTYNGLHFALASLFPAALALAAEKLPHLPDATEILQQAAAAYQPAYQVWRAGAGEERPGGARENLARACPLLRELALPELQEAAGLAIPDAPARSRVLLELMARNPDSNLLRRGGPAGLAFVQEAARELLRRFPLQSLRQKARALAFSEAIAELDKECIERWLSPGGSADLLALAIFLDSLPSLCLC